MSGSSQNKSSGIKARGGKKCCIQCGNGAPSTSTPTTIPLYADKDTGQIYFYKDGKWNLSKSCVQCGTGAPDSNTPTEPKIYIDNDSGYIYQYIGSWQLIGGNGIENRVFVPGSAFADPNDPQDAELHAWIDANVDPNLVGKGTIFYFNPAMPNGPTNLICDNCISYSVDKFNSFNNFIGNLNLGGINKVEMSFYGNPPYIGNDIATAVDLQIDYDDGNGYQVFPNAVTSTEMLLSNLPAVLLNKVTGDIVTLRMKFVSDSGHLFEYVQEMEIVSYTNGSGDIINQYAAYLLTWRGFNISQADCPDPLSTELHQAPVQPGGTGVTITHNGNTATVNTIITSPVDLLAAASLELGKNIYVLSNDADSTNQNLSGSVTAEFSLKCDTPLSDPSGAGFVWVSNKDANGNNVITLLRRASTFATYKPVFKTFTDVVANDTFELDHEPNEIYGEILVTLDGNGLLKDYSLPVHHTLAVAGNGKRTLVLNENTGVVNQPSWLIANYFIIETQYI